MHLTTRRSSGLYGRSASAFTPLLAALAISTPVWAGTATDEFAAALDAARRADALASRTSTAATTISGVITLRAQVNIPELEREMAEKGIRSRWRRHEFVVRRAQVLAAQTQPAVLRALEAERAAGSLLELQSFWVTNAIVATATPAAWSRILALPEIDRVHQNHEVTLRAGTLVDGSLDLPREDRSPGGGAELHTAPVANENALLCINVQPAWDAGWTGLGRLVCSFDSGADGTHPAFASRWRGLDAGVDWSHAWRDPYNNTQFPTDSNWHGTGVLGLMCAAPPDTVPIGVAYEAKWIAARTCCAQYNVQKILDNYQWAIDPDGNPSTIEDVPDVINNSWGTGANCDQTYWNAIDLVEAAGIVNVIAVDNSGPSPASVNSPESRATTPYSNFSVGNVDPNTPGFPIANTSGRGPSPCDFFSIKPEITAPGYFVRITYPNGGYAVGIGTSFAAPHVSGAIAVLRQVNPGLSVDQLKESLMVTSFDRGDAGEDNTYGWGVLDLGAAVSYVEANFPWAPVPLNLVGQVLNGHDIELNWSPPQNVNPANPLVGFRIYRQIDPLPYPETPLVELPFFPLTYTDLDVADGLYRYLVTAVYQDGRESEPSNEVIEFVEDPAAVGDGGIGVPRPLVAYPNPMRDGTELRYLARGGAAVSLQIYDAAGKRVRRLLSGARLDAGEQRFAWDGRNDAGTPLPAGTYFASVGEGDTRSACRITLLR